MHNHVPLSLAGLMAMAIIVIGCIYLLNESQDYLVSSRLHPMLTHATGRIVRAIFICCAKREAEYGF